MTLASTTWTAFKHLSTDPYTRLAAIVLTLPMMIYVAIEVYFTSILQKCYPLCRTCAVM